MKQQEEGLKWIRMPILVLMGMVLWTLAVVAEAKEARLYWNPPDTREDGSSIPEGTLDFYLYWALEENGSYRQALDGDEVLVLRGTEYLLPEEIPGGAECVWLSMSAYEPSTGMESTLSNAIQYCPGIIFTDGDDSGNGDGDGGSDDGSGEPEEPEIFYAPVPVFLDIQIVE